MHTHVVSVRAAQDKFVMVSSAPAEALRLLAPDGPRPLQVYHSTLEEKAQSAEIVCGCAILPIKTTTKGPAPIMEDGGALHTPRPAPLALAVACTRASTGLWAYVPAKRGSARQATT